MIERLEEELEIENLKKLLVLNPYGKVELKPWNKKNIKIIVNKEAKGTTNKNASEILRRIEIDKIEASDTLEVKTLLPPHAHILNGLTLTVNYIVYVPQEISVKIDTGNGSLSSSQENNETKNKLIDILMSSSKNIIKGFSGKLNVSSESGDIVLVDSSGELNISTKSGNVTVHSSKGELKIYSSSGNIDIDLFEGNISAQSRSGNITLSDIRTDVLSITSKSGNILVTKKWIEKERTIIKSESGNIKIKGLLTDMAAIWVDTLCGYIESLKDIDFSTHDNVAINLQTKSGNIKIE